jgi:hypothetical protein
MDLIGYCHVARSGPIQELTSSSGEYSVPEIVRRRKEGGRERKKRGGWNEGRGTGE